MSQLVDFYRGTARDAEQRSLADILAWNDDDLEGVHDFIQWLFPLPEPSRFNADAPLLTPEDIREFKQDHCLQAHLAKACRRFLAFLGLTLTEAGQVVEGPNFAARVPEVWAWPNHNWLRISRILRSLTLLGRQGDAQAFYQRLDDFYRSKRFPIPADTFGYWTKAVASKT